MAWFWLSIAIIFEIVATMALKLSQGFSKIFPSTIAIFGYLIAFIGLSKVLEILPVAITYAIWSGLGITLITLSSWAFLGQKLSMTDIIGISLVILGVLLIQIFSKSSP